MSKHIAEWVGLAIALIAGGCQSSTTDSTHSSGGTAGSGASAGIAGSHTATGGVGAGGAGAGGRVAKGGTSGAAAGTAGSSGAIGAGGGAARCTQSGGTLATQLCCNATHDFPNTCLVGACGCAPANSHTVQVCRCPAKACFDGTGCR